MTHARLFSVTHLLQSGALAGLYLVTGLVSLGLSANDGLASMVWPPAGIALATVLLFGNRFLPAIWLGAFIVVSVTSDSLVIALLSASGTTLGAWLARSALARLTPLDTLFDGMRSTLLFLFSAALIYPATSALVSAIAQTLVTSLQGNATGLFGTLGIWFFGDLMGILGLTPLLYLIGQHLQEHRVGARASFRDNHAEQILLVAVTTLVGATLYLLPRNITTHLLYLPFLLVLWAALRLPLIQALSLNLLVAAVSICGTLQDFADAPASAQLLNELAFLYLFLMTQSTTVLLVAGVVRDREKTAEQLLAAQRAAEAASQQKSQFLTNISHEIRTPLNGIIGVTGLMLPDAHDDKQREQLRIVQNSAESLLKLLNDLLDHARIEAGKLHIEMQTFSLQQLLRDINGLFESQAEAKGLRLRTQLAGDLPQYVVSDEVRIRQILVNLLGNALKFTEHGNIALSVTRVRDHAGCCDVQFSIEDTGIGIPADALERVFEPFTQADQSTARLYGGSGLGLTISRQLCEQLGGTLALHSTVGKGTRVVIQLPLRHASLNQEFSYRRQVEHRDSEVTGDDVLPARRILVAEDNAVNAQVTEQMLRNLGHDVAVAGNGEAVMAQWQRGFDLILMDCLMPVMDGYTAARRIRNLEAESGRRIPIIALTANTMNDERDKCLAAGMDDFLAKPVRLRQLDDALRRHLQRQPA